MRVSMWFQMAPENYYRHFNKRRPRRHLQQPGSQERSQESHKSLTANVANKEGGSYNLSAGYYDLCFEEVASNYFRLACAKRK